MFYSKVLCLVLLGAASSFAGVPSCQTVYEDKCWDEPSQQCHTVQKPHVVTSSKVIYTYIKIYCFYSILFIVSFEYISFFLTSTNLFLIETKLALFCTLSTLLP